MLNVSITNDYQVRPPDILAGRTVSGLLAEKTEAVRKVTESAEGQSPKSDLSAEELPRSAQDVKTQAQQQDLAIGEDYSPSLVTISDSVSIDNLPPLSEVKLPPIPFRDFLDMLFKEPIDTAVSVETASATTGEVSGLSEFLPLNIKV
jgi:hypothetical protein